MSKVTLTAQPTVKTGLTYTTTPIETDGMEFVNTGKEIIIATNTTAVSFTVTAEGVTAYDCGNVHDIGPITVAQNATVIIGPFDVGHYNDSTNKVQLTITGTEAAGCTVAVVKVA